MALYVWGHNNAQQLGLGVDDKVVFDVVRSLPSAALRVRG